MPCVVAVHPADPRRILVTHRRPSGCSIVCWLFLDDDREGRAAAEPRARGRRPARAAIPTGPIRGFAASLAAASAAADDLTRRDPAHFRRGVGPADSRYSMPICPGCRPGLHQGGCRVVADIVFAFDPAIDRPLGDPEARPMRRRRGNWSAGPLPTHSPKRSPSRRRGEGGGPGDLRPLARPDAGRAPRRPPRCELPCSTWPAAGCRTVVLAGRGVACQDLARMLGSPGTVLRHAACPARSSTSTASAVEFVAAGGGRHVPTLSMPMSRRRPAPAADRDRLGQPAPGASGDDTPGPAIRIQPPRFVPAAAASPAWTQPGWFWIWASPPPPGLAGRHSSSAAPSAAVSARAGRGSLLHADAPRPRGDARGRRCTSTGGQLAGHSHPAGRLADRSRSSRPPAVTRNWPPPSGRRSSRWRPANTPPLELVRCVVECGTSVSRRVRVGEIAAETLARLRELFDPKAFRAWCVELVADPGESLAPLGHARSGGRPGTTTSFTSALADIVAGDRTRPLRRAPPRPRPRGRLGRPGTDRVHLIRPGSSPSPPTSTQPGPNELRTRINSMFIERIDVERFGGTRPGRDRPARPGRAGAARHQRDRQDHAAGVRAGGLLRLRGQLPPRRARSPPALRRPAAGAHAAGADAALDRATARGAASRRAHAGGL